MIIGPSASELLEAVALFLTKELRPTVGDPALAFRTLIAGSLAGALAGELRGSQRADDAQRARLAGLGFVDDAASVPALEARLVSALKAGSLDEGATWAHAKASLDEMLTLTNPRFDLKQHID